jgi:hypothetical protein
MKKRRRAWVGLVLALGVALSSFACGGKESKRQVVGESHFMRGCYDGDDCGAGLTCLWGFCTRACDVASEACAELDPRATCSVLNYDPRPPSACAVACADSAVCAQVSSRLVCQRGFCAGPPLQHVVGGNNLGEPCNVATGLDTYGVACTTGVIHQETACLDDANDACEPATSSDCPGRCQELQPRLVCSGLLMAGSCPDDLECRAPTPGEPNEDVQGYCTSPDSPGCEGNGDACPELDGADCWSPSACVDAEPACPVGYARLRTSTACGACTDVQLCPCSTSAECPAPAVCHGSRCVLPVAP